MSLFTSNLGAQSIDLIAGQYKIGTTLIVIKPDSTFLLIDMGTLGKGKVEINGKSGKLIPSKPKETFVLYGRTKNSIAKGNIINYQSGVTEVRPLINYDEDDNDLKKMKKIFNDNANCISSPTVIKNPNNNPKFYFSVADSKDVYEFENNQGFNDFIVLYLTPSISVNEIKFTISNDGKSIAIQNEQLQKLSRNNVPEAENEKLFKMYDRAYANSEYYYCNPSYNYFEEEGINLADFNKVQNGKEYYYSNKTIEPTSDSDYHNYGTIYEYKKITALILKNQQYTIDTGSIFHFKCD